MTKFTLEHFECPRCKTTREIGSLGHAVRVPCNKCGKPMTRVDKTEK